MEMNGSSRQNTRQNKKREQDFGNHGHGSANSYFDIRASETNEAAHSIEVPTSQVITPNCLVSKFQ